jgi:hypothetical protein
LDPAERYVATMPDLFETTQIPDDFAHWDALAARVAVAASCESKQSGFHWLATSRGGSVVASLLMAVMSAFVLLLPAPGSSASTRSDDWARVLAPADDVGKLVILRDNPPSVGGLLLGNPSRAVR